MKRRDFLKVGLCSAAIAIIPKFAFGDSPETIFEKRFAGGETIINEKFVFNKGVILRGKGRVSKCYFNFTSIKDNTPALYFPDLLNEYEDGFFTKNTISLRKKYRGAWPGPEAWR